MTRSRLAAKTASIFAVLILPLILTATAHCAFDSYYLYGPDAVTSALGAPPLATEYSRLDYLTNPALIGRLSASRYSLAYSTYPGIKTGNDATNITLSMARRRMGLSIILDRTDFEERDMIVYTTPFSKSDKRFLGANLSAFQYSTPDLTDAFSSTGVAAEGLNSTGFAADLGYSALWKNKIKYGITIQNLISTLESDRKGNDPRLEVFELPRIINVGTTMPVRPWLDGYVGVKYISEKRPSFGSTNDLYFYLGFVYRHQKSPVTFQTSYNREGNPATGDDQFIRVGAAGTYQNYTLALNSASYHNTYNSPLSLTATYKAEAGKPWYTDPGKANNTPPVPIAQKEPEKFEAPLPAPGKENKPEPPASNTAAVDKTEPAKPTPTTASTPANNPSSSQKPASVEEPENSIKITEYSIEPTIILIPSYKNSKFNDISSHWSKPSIIALGEKGYYPDLNSDFQPNTPISREEFYRLLFIYQISGVFSKPVTVFFKTPYPVTIDATLSSPDTKPISIQKGTYEKSGAKRLIINAKTLEDNDIFPGRYKLRLSLSSKGMADRYLDNYITVLDTSINFLSLAALAPAEKNARISDMITGFREIGIDASYLEKLESDKPLTRIEALMASFKLLDRPMSQDIPEASAFKDIATLNSRELKAITLATAKLPALDNSSLMGGYSDNTFQPDRPLTNAEAAVFVDRLRKLSKKDFDITFPTAPTPTPSNLIATTADIKTPIPSQKTGLTQTPKPPAPSPAPIAKLPLPSPGTVPVNNPVAAPPTSNPEPNQKPVTPKPSIAKSPNITPSPAPPSQYVVAGSYFTRDNALKSAAELQSQGFKPILVVEKIGATDIFHIAIAAFRTRQETDYFISRTHLTGNYSLTAMSFASPASAPASGSLISDIPGDTKPTTRQGESELELTMPGTSPIPGNFRRNIDEYTTAEDADPAHIIR